MKTLVYLIMLLMFLMVAVASYMVTKMLLTMLFKWMRNRRTNKQLEAVYRETMKL